jgi:CheY-like chemotaxis protein
VIHTLWAVTQVSRRRTRVSRLQDVPPRRDGLEPAAAVYLIAYAYRTEVLRATFNETTARKALTEDLSNTLTSNECLGRRCHPAIRKSYGEAMTVIRIDRRRPVLFVSRDIDTQDMYVFALRAERIPALSVSACQDAVALARQTDISVVVFDVERPADWDAVSELRRELPADVPIVVLTGWVRTDGGNRALARQLGCSGFLAKPVPPSVMIDVVQRATAGCPWTEYVSDI